MPYKIKKPYVYLRKDGRYEGRYRKYLSSDRKEFKQISVYGTTYEEALEKALKGQVEYSIDNQEKNPLLIKELMEQWLLEIEKTMKPSSYSLYRNYAIKYLLPKIGDKYAAEFNENALISILESIRVGSRKEAILSQNTIYILEEMIRSIFRFGAEKKIVPEIFLGKVKYRTQNQKAVNSLTELEIQQLLSMTRQEMDIQIMIILPLYTGVSLSELCGLKWEDIDLESGKIFIHRNLKRIPKLSKSYDKGEKAVTYMAEYELSKEECREFVMPKKLIELLKRIVNEKTVTQGMYITASSEGRTLEYQLKAVGKRAGISDLTFRTLRDTFAIMCLKAGGDAYSLAYVMGITVKAVCDRYKPWIVRKYGFLKEIG